MKTARYPRMALVVLLALVAVASAGAQEVLTNDAVIAMKNAGLSEGVILAKIRSSQSKFDVSTQGLVTLKGAGLSDQVIEAMVGHTGPAAGVSPASAPAAGTMTAARTPGQLTQGRDTIFHAKGDQYVELTAAAAQIETNFAFFSQKSELVLKGKKAQYRTAEREPVFYSVWTPVEAPLVKLKPGDDADDRNLKISSGAFMPYGGTQKQGVRNEDKIDVDAEKDPRGFYRIRPRKALAPGEYGFIVTGGFAGGAGGKVYDFGID
ncbi:MAG: hypothetical protein L0027_07815 [Candidatus Rokubacteria bacterium]|nr:hypothetical protein [Candidatus Rokubacteria bacterium]